MQAPFFSYGTSTATSSQNTYETAVEPGTWQQPGIAQNTGQYNQDTAYYTSVITAPPQTYFTDGASDNGNNFDRGAKTTSVSNSSEVTSGNLSMNQSRGGTQYGSDTSQYMESNQFQGNTGWSGTMNETASDAGYYRYPSDQYMSSSGNRRVDNQSYYNTMCLGMGNNSGGMTKGNTYNSGGMMIGNNVDNIGMGQSGNMSMGNGGGRSSNEGIGVAHNIHGMEMGFGGDMDNQNCGRYPLGSGMKGNLQNTSQDYVDGYDGCDNVQYAYGSRNSNYGHYRDRGNRSQHQQRPPVSSASRGRYNSWSRDGSHHDSGYRKKANDFHKMGGRGSHRDFFRHGREVNNGPDFHHSSHSGWSGSGVGAGGLQIHLNPTSYNRWCFYRKSFGKRDSELAEHLLEVHEQFCLPCKERNEAKKPTHKRKVSEETEDSSVNDEVEGELSEEELKMKELMGFAGFKSTKGSKPKNSSFSSFDCTKTTAKKSKDEDEEERVDSTSLTHEERKAMAALNGFSVFAKTDAIDPATVGFGAPAITFTPMNEPDDSSKTS